MTLLRQRALSFLARPCNRDQWFAAADIATELGVPLAELEPVLDGLVSKDRTLVERECREGERDDLVEVVEACRQRAVVLFQAFARGAMKDEASFINAVDVFATELDAAYSPLKSTPCRAFYQISWPRGIMAAGDWPSDGTCRRCGSAPRNADGLCASCVGELGALFEEELALTLLQALHPDRPDDFLSLSDLSEEQADRAICAARAVQQAIVSRADPSVADADSGMDGETVAQAEMLWANLPTGRPWTSLATHEKALVCHQLARLPVAVDDWQPIETAPTGDGTILIGWGEYRERDGEQPAFMRWYESIGGWSVNSIEFYPTHWKPLPTPPSNRSPS